MTALAAPLRPGAIAPRPASFDRLVIERLHDRRFWLVQATIFGITFAHDIVEGTGLHDSPIGEKVGLQHLMVLLYLVPVVFASLRFGLEGGFLAGLSSIVLAIPNVVLWHRDGYQWVIELFSMAIVLAVGVAVAVPVERERRQWRRAEDTSRRLALVNGIAEMLAGAREPEAALGVLLDRLLAAVDLEAVAIGAVDPPFVTVRGRTAGAADALRGTVERDAQDRLPDAGIMMFPLTAGASHLGVLAVEPGHPLRAEDHALLAAVAHHLALELEQSRFQRRERERLQEYTRGVLAAQEAERTRIARDLHDDVAQPLVQLGRGLGAFRDVEGVPAEVTARAEELRDLSLSTLGLVRAFAQHLRPPALDDLGLVPAIARLAREQGSRCGASVTFSVEGVARRLSPDTEAAAFRIAQEALRNVEKHAGASHVQVRLGFEDGALRVWVEDDGCGFDVHAFSARTSGELGIEGMRERAELQGGAFRLGPGAAGGTTVAVDLPV